MTQFDQLPVTALGRLQLYARDLGEVAAMPQARLDHVNGKVGIKPP